MRFYWTVGYMGDELVCIKSPVQANCPFNGPRDVSSLMYFTLDETERLSRVFTKIESGKTLEWFRNEENWKSLLIEALGEERYRSYQLEIWKADQVAKDAPAPFKNMGFYIPGGSRLLDADGKRMGDNEPPPPKIIFDPNQ